MWVYCERENADRKSQSMTWTSFLGDFENMRAWNISRLREIKILIYRSLSVQWSYNDIVVCFWISDGKFIGAQSS